MEQGERLFSLRDRFIVANMKKVEFFDLRFREIRWHCSKMAKLGKTDGWDAYVLTRDDVNVVRGGCDDGRNADK